MTDEQQLILWMQGRLVGKKEKAHVVRYIAGKKIEECCPDFSCCSPELLAPYRLRKEFFNYPESRHKMLMGFLGQLLANMPKQKKSKIYLTDGRHEGR